MLRRSFRFASLALARHSCRCGAWRGNDVAAMEQHRAGPQLQGRRRTGLRLHSSSSITCIEEYMMEDCTCGVLGSYQVAGNGAAAVGYQCTTTAIWLPCARQGTYL